MSASSSGLFLSLKACLRHLPRLLLSLKTCLLNLPRLFLSLKPCLLHIPRLFLSLKTSRRHLPVCFEALKRLYVIFLRHTSRWGCHQLLKADRQTVKTTAWDLAAVREAIQTAVREAI